MTTKPAPAFDLITCVGRAYQTLWFERRYILRLAAAAFLFKILFFAIGYTNGGDDNIWRLSIIMVPAWIVEGWMLSHIVRLVILDQRWPFRPTGNLAADGAMLTMRYRGVMGGAILFALTQLIIGGWFALLMTLAPISVSAPPEPVSITAEAAFGACVLLGIGIYFFRFLWLYAVAAAGVALRPVAIRLTHGMMTSIRLIGLWLLCAVPMMVVVQVMVGFILMLVGPDNAGDAMTAISIIAKVVLDIVKNLLCALAVAYAFQGLFGKGARA